MENKIISISDITTWLYCPRKLYLMKVKGIKAPANRNMILGKLRHNILESFSKHEKYFVQNIIKDEEKLDLVFMYEDFLKKIADKVFLENSSIIEKFMLDKEYILKNLMKSFAEDLKLRVENIKKGTSKGYFGAELWKNLDSVYLSEIHVESEALGLKGRVDRIEVQRDTNNVIPYELKTREDRIFLSDELQLTAYAMLLEDMYKMQIKKGVIELGNKRQELEITEKNKSHVLQLAEEIRSLEKNPIPQIHSNFNKCNQCDLKEKCLEL